MSTDPNKPMFANQYETEAPPKKKGKGCLILALLLLGVPMICCIGVCGYGWFSMRNAFTEDPELVAQRTQEIAQIEVLEGLKPRFYMDMKPFGFEMMKMSIYTSDADEGEPTDLLFLANFADFMMQDPEQLKSQMSQSMNQQGSKEVDMPSLNINSSRQESYTVGGEEIELDFADATDSKSGAGYYKVTGFVPNSSGKTVLIDLQVHKDKFTEDQIRKMIEGIK